MTPRPLPAAPNIRSTNLPGVEVAWFAPICDDDYAFLGVPDNALKSTWAHAATVANLADSQGFDNMLCPSSYQVGQDTLSYAAAVAPQLRQLSLLTAVRCGEVHPPMLARTLAALDHMLEGRLTINIISSDLPGEELASAARYQKSREVIAILKQCWTQEVLNFTGDFYKFSGLSTAPAKPYQQHGGPLLYFGGMAEPARELAAEHADVFLMWPETEERLAATMHDLSARAERFGRTIDFGLRVHIIVRETQAEARAYADQLVSQLADETGDAIRARALDAKSLGVARQTEMRGMADNDGYIEPFLWTGIGRARSGCGCALVGDPDQILGQLQRYRDMGIRSFIFSGYPNANECALVGRLILPRLQQIKLATAQNRIPKATPATPLGLAPRL